jgi:alanine dehydrogenase
VAELGFDLYGGRRRALRVTNMPGAAERTLSSVKAPFVLTIADKGYAPALMADPCVTGAISMTGM